MDVVAKQWEFTLTRWQFILKVSKPEEDRDKTWKISLYRIGQDFPIKEEWYDFTCSLESVLCRAQAMMIEA